MTPLICVPKMNKGHTGLERNFNFNLFKKYQTLHIYKTCMQTLWHKRELLPDCGLELGCSEGFGCINTKGSSTDTSLTKHSVWNQCYDILHKYKIWSISVSNDIPSTRHHKLHFNSVGHQDSQDLLIGHILHSVSTEKLQKAKQLFERFCQRVYGHMVWVNFISTKNTKSTKA